ncbi:MAG: hypothetical protein RH860_01820 [Cytophagales bacterium]
MKKKLTTYLLLALVLAIWTVILYRIINQLNTGDKQSSIPVNEIQNSIRKDNLKQKYQFVFDYRDPFLKNNYKRVAFVKKETNNNFNQRQRPPRRQDKFLANIEYFGTIKKGSENLAILAWEGKNKIVKRGVEIDNFRIKAIYSDSLILSRDDENYTIQKIN